MTEFTCVGCGQNKSSDQFYKSSDCSRGFKPNCKKCMKPKMDHKREWTRRYEKTEKGFIMRMYRNMKSRIEGVQHKKKHLYEGKYLLSKEEFYDWIKSQSDFKSLFLLYEASNWERRLAPSVDRVDPSKGYSIDNMEVVTMSENSRRSTKTRN